MKAPGESKCLEERSGFSGRRGTELKNTEYQEVRNNPTIIQERKYSAHALDQMQNLGIPPSVVEQTIKNGKTFPTKAGTTGYYDSINNVRVIVSAETEQVITVIPGASK